MDIRGCIFICVLTTGTGIAKSIVDQIKLWGIDSSQIEGGSFDGQYFHLSVPEHLREILGLSNQFKCVWDPLFA